MEAMDFIMRVHYIRAKLRKVTKIRTVACGHNVGM